MSVRMMLLQVFVRWLEFLSLTTLLGGLAFRCVILRSSLLSRDEFASFERLRRRVEASAIVLLALTSIADLLLRTTVMAGGPASLVHAVPLVLRRTHYGTVWVGRMGLVGLLGAAWLAAWRRILRFPWLALVSLAAATLVALTTTLSGHAADWGDVTVPVLNDWLHLLAISIWIGGLFTLGFVLRASLSSPSEKDRTESLAVIAGRFSRLAVSCAAVFLVTGSYNAWVQVASLSPLVTTFYGRTVVAKLSLLLVALMMAALNRYYFLPLLGHSSGTREQANLRTLDRLAGLLRMRNGPRGGKGISRQFVRSVRLEWLVAVGMLACTALLTQVPPARHIRRHEHREPHALHQPEYGETPAKRLLVQRQRDGKFPLDMPRLSW
jgi:putative copper resistance protein D